MEGGVEESSVLKERTKPTWRNDILQSSNVDYRLFSSRMNILDLRPKQVNVSLIGKVKSLDQERKMLVFFDENGTIDIQLCPELFAKTPFEAGQCILLTGLSTKVCVYICILRRCNLLFGTDTSIIVVIVFVVKQQTEKLTLFLTGSLKEGSSVVNLNFLTGLLTSEPFWHPIQLVNWPSQLFIYFVSLNNTTKKNKKKKNK
jgi:hypothetical protein